MSWENIVEEHQKKHGRKYILSDNEEERKFIIESILKEYPLIDRKKAEEVIDRCFQIIPPPRHTDIFMGVVAALLM